MAGNRHLPGDCPVCDRFHHCCHLDQNVEDPGTQEICCHCGETLPVLRLPVENHGPWAWWLYTPQKVAPEDDNCPGAMTPPVGYHQAPLNPTVPVLG